MNYDLEESAKRFGQGLVVSVCLSIVIVTGVAYLLEALRSPPIEWACRTDMECVIEEQAQKEGKTCTINSHDKMTCQ